MRGLGDFQRAQMRDIDSRIPELFGHVRQAIDLLERITLQPYRPAAESKRKTEIEIKSLGPSITPADVKLSYTVKEACKLVGISATTLYKVLGRRELKAVKLDNRTLILAKDLERWVENLPALR
jgi:excisionase family DNA binding protein